MGRGAPCLPQKSMPAKFPKFPITRNLSRRLRKQSELYNSNLQMDFLSLSFFCFGIHLSKLQVKWTEAIARFSQIC